MMKDKEQNTEKRGFSLLKAAKIVCLAALPLALYFGIRGGIAAAGEAMAPRIEQGVSQAVSQELDEKITQLSGSIDIEEIIGTAIREQIAESADGLHFSASEMAEIIRELIRQQFGWGN